MLTMGLSPCASETDGLGYTGRRKNQYRKPQLETDHL